MQQAQLKQVDQHPDVEINEQWAYNIKYNDYRIYIANDQMLTMFQLKWA